MDSLSCCSVGSDSSHHRDGVTNSDLVDGGLILVATNLGVGVDGPLTDVVIAALERQRSRAHCSDDTGLYANVLNRASRILNRDVTVENGAVGSHATEDATRTTATITRTLGGILCGISRCSCTRC